MVAITTPPILRLSNCCIFCTTSIVHLADLSATSTVSKSQYKKYSSIDIINPEKENKHKTPYQNKKSLNSKPTEIVRTSVNPKTHSKEHQTAFPKKQD